MRRRSHRSTNCRWDWPSCHRQQDATRRRVGAEVREISSPPRGATAPARCGHRRGRHRRRHRHRGDVRDAPAEGAACRGPPMRPPRPRGCRARPARPRRSRSRHPSLWRRWRTRPTPTGRVIEVSGPDPKTVLVGLCAHARVFPNAFPDRSGTRRSAQRGRPPGTRPRLDDLATHDASRSAVTLARAAGWRETGATRSRSSARRRYRPARR